MYYVYIIYNKSVSKFYIGQTKDLEERLVYHNTKRFKNSYTSRFVGKWELIYKECYPNRAEALKREKLLKGYKGRQFIKLNIVPK